MKSCAVINDLSGFGKCSLGVALPVLSVLGIEAHSLPTAVLSSQTAFDSYASLSLTDKMVCFADEWKKLGVQFDGIMTGFVTDEKQLDIISSFIDEFNRDDTIVMVDPVMADNGSLYDGYNTNMCNKIRELCLKASVITPNIAELAYLVDKPYSTDLNKINDYANELIKRGIDNIVVTGYKDSDNISNIAFTGNSSRIFTTKAVGGYYSGCGDILSSVVLGELIKGKDLFVATQIATKFIYNAILNTDTVDGNFGIDFEKVLGELYEKQECS